MLWGRTAAPSERNRFGRSLRRKRGGWKEGSETDLKYSASSETKSVAAADSKTALDTFAKSMKNTPNCSEMLASLAVNTADHGPESTKGKGAVSGACIGETH